MCKRCNKDFTRLSFLEKHERTKHNENIGDNLNCDMCNIEFTSYKELKTHIESKHTIDKHLICPYCDFKRILLSGFSRSLEKVKYHIDKKHPEHPGEKKYKCDVCHENFIFQSSIQMHKDFRHGKEKEDGEKDGTRFSILVS